jgi:hypothetical protein
MPRSSQLVVVEHLEVCIALVMPSENLKLDLCVSLEKRWELKETPSLCGSLNNKDISKPLWLNGTLG